MLFLSRRKLSIDLISTIYPTLDDWSFERPGPVSYHWTSENLNGGKWGMTNKIWTAIYHCNSSMYIHKLLLWSVYQIQSQCKKHMVYQEKLIRQNVELRFFFSKQNEGFLYGPYIYCLSLWKKNSSYTVLLTCSKSSFKA